MYASVPEDTRNEIFTVIDTPKKIEEIARALNLSKRKTGAYLRLLSKKGEIRQIPDFKDLRSFYYVINSNR
ncbi:MAG: FaeA/PapI family transcriptional regulator [Candidatus Odinarchaeota archaeon]